LQKRKKPGKGDVLLPSELVSRGDLNPSTPLSAFLVNNHGAMRHGAQLFGTPNNSEGGPKTGVYHRMFPFS
jgi:hypothetical protein